MYRKYYLVEVVLLLLLSHGGWNGPSVTLLSCTSEASKLVRDVVQKRFLSVVQRYRVPLPLECPLHPRRDMFWWLKTDIQETWRCPVCGQNFRCENTFVTHWDASHARALGRTVETVCLDEYCDVFRCDVLRQRQQLEEEVEVQAVGPVKRSCDPSTLTRVHRKCRSLVRQCTIGMLANLSSKDFQDIEEDLDEAICSFLTCDKYWDDFDSQIRHVPALVIAFFGLLIITSFCFCYYGTWILLEKQPSSSALVCCNCQNPPSSSSETRRRQKSRKTPDFNHRHKSKPIKSDPQQDPGYGRYLTERKYRRESPEFIKFDPSEFVSRNSPRRVARRNHLEYSSRKNSPEYASRRNSPEYISRQNSPEYFSRGNSPEYINRRNSPEYISRRNSPEYIDRRNSPEYISRRNSPEYISSRNSPEYVVRENSSKYISRHNSPEYSSRLDAAEYTSEQNSREYVSRQSPPAIKAKESPISEADEVIRRPPSRC